MDKMAEVIEFDLFINVEGLLFNKYFYQLFEGMEEPQNFFYRCRLFKRKYY